MLRRQPSSKRAATLFPYATLVRSGRRCPAAWPGPPPQARQSARPRFRHQPAPRPRRLLPPPAACAATSGTGTACRRRVRVPPWSILLAGDGARRGSARPLDRWAATERLVLGILRLLALSLHEDLFHVVDLHEVSDQRHDFGRHAHRVDDLEIGREHV